jgi:hypothetical protein
VINTVDGKKNAWNIFLQIKNQGILWILNMENVQQVCWVGIIRVV